MRDDRDLTQCACGDKSSPLNSLSLTAASIPRHSPSRSEYLPTRHYATEAAPASSQVHSSPVVGRSPACRQASTSTPFSRS